VNPDRNVQLNVALTGDLTSTNCPFRRLLVVPIIREKFQSKATISFTLPPTTMYVTSNVYSHAVQWGWVVSSGDHKMDSILAGIVGEPAHTCRTWSNCTHGTYMTMITM